jgi:hypothetical protein
VDKPDLKAKYGGGNTRTTINRAIRAELAGGNECLDAVHALEQLRREWASRGFTEGMGDVEAALRHAGAVYERLKAEILDRYEMPRG